MLFSKPKSHIGVDIGTSNIKIVQLQEKDGKFVLETYGIVNVAYQISNKDSTTAISQTAQILKNLVARSRATTNRIVASLPNSVVFTSVIDMPTMPDAELKTAVEFEAKKYVPLPLNEVTLSWSIIKEKQSKASSDVVSGNMGKVDKSKTKVLLTAVPNVVVENYLNVFKEAGLDTVALEIEALSLIRSLVNEEDRTVLLIDIGAKNTSINLVDNGYLRFSKNLNVGGDTVTTSIAQSLGINFARAEQFKKDFGLSPEGQQIPQVIKPILDIIKNESAQLLGLFESKGDRIDQILLSGAGSKLPALTEYFATLGKEVTLANPWVNVAYPAELGPIITPLGLNLAVAVGLAMRKN